MKLYAQQDVSVSSKLVTPNEVRNMVRLVIVLFSLCFSAKTEAASGSYSPDKLQQAVNALAKRLPMQVDAVTTITGVVLLNNSAIQYRYGLNRDKVVTMAAAEARMSVDEFTRAAKSKFGSLDNLLRIWSRNVLSKQIATSNCTTPDTRAWLSNGITLVHTIFETGGGFLHEEVVNYDRCR